MKVYKTKNINDICSIIALSAAVKSCIKKQGFWHVLVQSQ